MSDEIDYEEKLLEILSQNKDVWKTEAEFFSWIRGGIRGAVWMRHPVKLKLINSQRRQIPNPKKKGKATVWGATCALCKEEYVIGNMQVDHKFGGDYSLKTVSDIETFFKRVVFVTEDDLQLVCKNCNYAATYAKRFGMSFEDALCTKYIIKLIKEKKIEEFYTSRGLVMPKKALSIREEAIKILIEEMNNV